MTALPILSSPIRIGTMTLRNRLVMAPMTTDYADDDLAPSRKLIDFLVARARGGVGLITVEACTVDRRHRETPHSLSLADDEVLDRHRSLTRAIHDEGAKVQPQITHPGPDSLSLFFEGAPAVGPSVAVASVSGVACRELGLEEIDEIVERYARTAARAREAGYDGVELHAAHAYMLAGSFLSPWRNKRTDLFSGKTLEGRLRFLLAVVRAIKAATGEDFPLTVRLSGYERVPGGRDVDDTQRLAPRLVDAGVDAFHISGGVSDRLVSQIVRGAMHRPGYNAVAAQAVKQVVDVPVIVVGRFQDPRDAEIVLRRGQADLIAVGRALLADPELARKAMEGRYRDIRGCISCEHCVDSMARGTMGCAVNGTSGFERERGLRPAERPKRVFVVGGGPAGMEAARVAALRGHHVTLFDEKKRLGGALSLAATTHSENQRLLDHLLDQVVRLRIDTRCGLEVTPETVRRAEPEVVIVATGGRLASPPIPGDDLPHVLSGALLRRMIGGALGADEAKNLPDWQWLALQAAGPFLRRWGTPAALRAATKLWMPVGRRVVIVGADLASIELAEFLAARGRRVMVVDEGPKIAPEVGRKRRGEHMDRLDDLGVTINTEVHCERITRDGVVVRAGERRATQIAADSVIVAGNVEPNRSLFDAIEGMVPESYAIGDCTGLGLIAKAIGDADRVACAI